MVEYDKLYAVPQEVRMELSGLVMSEYYDDPYGGLYTMGPEFLTNREWELLERGHIDHIKGGWYETTIEKARESLQQYKKAKFNFATDIVVEIKRRGICHTTSRVLELLMEKGILKWISDPRMFKTSNISGAIILNGKTIRTFTTSFESTADLGIFMEGKRDREYWFPDFLEGNDLIQLLEEEL